MLPRTSREAGLFDVAAAGRFPVGKHLRGGCGPPVHRPQLAQRPGPASCGPSGPLLAHCARLGPARRRRRGRTCLRLDIAAEGFKPSAGTPCDCWWTNRTWFRIDACPRVSRRSRSTTSAAATATPRSTTRPPGNGPSCWPAAATVHHPRGSCTAVHPTRPAGEARVGWASMGPWLSERWSANGIRRCAAVAPINDVWSHYLSAHGWITLPDGVGQVQPAAAGSTSGPFSGTVVHILTAEPAGPRC